MHVALFVSVCLRASKSFLSERNTTVRAALCIAAICCQVDGGSLWNTLRCVHKGLLAVEWQLCKCSAIQGLGCLQLSFSNCSNCSYLHSNCATAGGGSVTQPLYNTLVVRVLTQEFSGLDLVSYSSREIKAHDFTPFVRIPSPSC